MKRIMENDTDLDISRMLASACARAIVWLFDRVQSEGDVLLLSGWALVTKGTHDTSRFHVNGVPFESVTWMDSPDLAEHFYGVANSGRARFECRVNKNVIPADDYYRFEFIQDGDIEDARRSAWWIRAGLGAGGPSGERVSRVIGSEESLHFEIGGATLFYRIDDYLRLRFGRGFEDFEGFLDWGCGAGRLLSHLSNIKGPEIWGSDIDHDNLKYCQDQFPFAKCSVFPLRPPTQVADGKFDLIVGISVCTHLSEKDQQLWLKELHRMTMPGALVMLSVQGFAQSALYRVNPKLIRDLRKHGFVTMGVNPRINDIVGEENYYKDVVQTRAHIESNWGKHFEVLEFLDGFAANQDMVVMRKRLM